MIARTHTVPRGISSGSAGSAHRGRRVRPLAAALALALLAGCSDDDTPVASGPDTVVPPTGEPRAALRTFGDGEAFTGALRDALIAQRESGDRYGATDDEIDVDFAEADAGVDADGAGGDGALAAPGSNDAADVGTNGVEGAAGRDDVTGTNVQEAGVDERDRVKTDGERLYVLSSGYAYTDGAVPFEGEGEGEGEDSIAIDGTSLPAPDAARTVLRVLEMDRETPDARPLADLAIELDGRFADGFYLYTGEDGSRRAILSASGGGYWQSWNSSVAFRGLDTLIQDVDVSAPDATDRRERRLRIDGQSVSSRRIGRHLFIASRFYPNIAGVSPWDVDADTWRREVDQASTESLLPGWTLDDGERQALIDPAACFVTADAEADRPFYAPDIVTLTMIDLETMRPVDSECYLGASETLYASPDAVFIATTRYDYEPFAIDEGGFTGDDVFFQDPRLNTDIHRFDIGDGSLDYAGSGQVRGHLGWNAQRKPYRLSARDGVLRVATVAAEQGVDRSPIILSTLRANGQGELELLAELPNERRPEPIGKPGEQLYASRYVGDRAYLVTFRQTDPLYVVDLSRPEDPEVLGELEIDGYSDWLQPIGETHLLGIGRDAVSQEVFVGGVRTDGGGALVQGVKVSLFDVADPRAPREVQSVLIGERGTDSPALYDAKAITVQPATAARPARVAFGVDVAGNPEPTASPVGEAAFRYNPWQFSALYGFDVRTGADAGIERRGVMVAESVGDNGASYGPLQGQDRSVIAGDAVYYVHGSEVRVAPWGDFAAAQGPR